MKKVLILTALCAATLLSAQQMNINGDFAGTAIRSAAPKGWCKSDMKNPNVAESAVLKGKDGKLQLVILPGKLKTSFYNYSSGITPFQAGDKLEVRFKASGKGNIQVLYYGYNSKKSNFTNGFAPIIKLTDKPTEHKFTIQGHDGREKLVGILFAFDVMPNTEATIYSIQAEIKKAPAKK